MVAMWVAVGAALVAVVAALVAVSVMRGARSWANLGKGWAHDASMGARRAEEHANLARAAVQELTQAAPGEAKPKGQARSGVGDAMAHLQGLLRTSAEQLRGPSGPRATTATRRGVAGRSGARASQTGRLFDEDGIFPAPSASVDPGPSDSGGSSGGSSSGSSDSGGSSGGGGGCD